MRSVGALSLLIIASPALAEPRYNPGEANSTLYDSLNIMTRTERYHRYDSGNQAYACPGPAYAAAHDSFYTDGKCWHFIYPTKREWFEMYVPKR
jgi:hypothetical protein